MTEKARDMIEVYDQSGMSAMTERGALDAAIARLRNENDRMRATLLNIQALAERGFPIDHAKLAERCRRALNQSAG